MLRLLQLANKNTAADSFDGLFPSTQPLGNSTQYNTERIVFHLLATVKSQLSLRAWKTLNSMITTVNAEATAAMIAFLLVLSENIKTGELEWCPTAVPDNGYPVQNFDMVFRQKATNRMLMLEVRVFDFRNSMISTDAMVRSFLDGVNAGPDCSRILANQPLVSRIVPVVLANMRDLWAINMAFSGQAIDRTQVQQILTAINLVNANAVMTVYAGKASDLLK